MTAGIAAHLEVETTGARVRDFAESLQPPGRALADANRVPHTFPVRWLADPRARQSIAAAMPKSGGVLLQTGASFAYRAPLGLDMAYALEARVACGAADALSLDASLADLDGSPIADLSLHVLAVTALPHQQPARKAPPASPNDLPPLALGAFSASDVLRYAEASGDENPIHSDPVAARAAGLPGCVVQGMLLFGRSIAALPEWQAGAAWGGGTRLTRSSVRFLRPVLVDAPVTMRGRIMPPSNARAGLLLRLFLLAEGDALAAIADLHFDDAG